VREPFAQLGYRQVRMRLDQNGDPGGYFRSETALRSRSVAHPLWLPARQPLAEDLLHIPKTHAEHRRQLPETAMPLCVRFEYLAPQIVLVGSRHPCLRRRVSPDIHYTITDIALGERLPSSHREVYGEKTQLDRCAQLTKKRVKSGITDAFKWETPPYWGAIEIKDRAEISAETSDVLDRRRRGRGMVLLDSAPSMENL
jgi:hypothetical protein